ncbi:MAG TPA: hypothetical protein VG755_42880 [Nannocystaceae bacterium]|nr:hypothetical protein [Nannocystaceae bacterium]
MRRKLIVTTLVAALASPVLSGCSVINLIVQAAKKRSTNMNRWKVEKIELGVRGESVCARGSIQLAVFADAQHKKRAKKHKRMETWTDAENRFGKMGFEEFVFTVKNGTLDPKTGMFSANDDMLATVDGFAFTAKYKKDPKLAGATVEYVPDYACIGVAGSNGPAGEDGEPGEDGDRGRSGEGGSEDTPGGDGKNGGSAGNGGDGKDGGAGPNIVAYATVVKTPHHDHLVLVKIEGDADDMVLLDPKGPMTIVARGGDGGDGGRGGEGGDGGSGLAGSPGGNGGDGGNGGIGGNGARGGPGGSIRLIYDAAFPELATAITLDASGGDAGDAGAIGEAGDGGFPGNGRGDGKSGAHGTDGSDGQGGNAGEPGQDGTTSAEAGDVSSAFAALPPNVQRVSG